MLLHVDVSGPPKSGKTKLIEQLVAYLQENGNPDVVFSESQGPKFRLYDENELQNMTFVRDDSK